MLVNLLLLIAFIALAFAEKTGTNGIPAISWQSVAMDSSGQYMVAAGAYNTDWDQGYALYLSDDYGVNWRQSKSSPLDWRNIYSDSTGQVLIGYAVYNSFSSTAVPPLQVSKDRGNTWTTGVATSSFAITNDIIGPNSSSLWTVVDSKLYHSTDLGTTWTATYNNVIPSKQGTSYSAVIGPDFAIDSTGKFIYAICDGGLCVSHNSGQTFTPYYSLLVNSVETDSTGQYVYILTDKYLQYSADYASTWTVLKDYSTKSTIVTTNFLSITSDAKNVFTLEKSSSTSTTTNLIRYTISNKVSSYYLFTNYTINDGAVGSNGLTVVLSTAAGYLLTTKDSYNWVTHNL